MQNIRRKFYFMSRLQLQPLWIDFNGTHHGNLLPGMVDMTLVTSQHGFKGQGRVAQLAERRSLAGELTLSCARPAADR